MNDWPHAPIHRFSSEGFFFVTAGTYLKAHHYRTSRRLDQLRSTLFTLAAFHDVWLQAWCLLSNHYHLVVKAKGAALRTMLSELHSLEARACNEQDGTPSRKVWYQFRDTELTHQRSWMARLRYTNENAVHHGVARNATTYRWCSASWFERKAPPAFVKSVMRFGLDRIQISDEFTPVLDAEVG